MSGFKSNIIIIAGVLLIVCIIFGSCILSYYSYNRHVKAKPELFYPHTLSIYTAEGDTLLELDTESDCIKIWIEENGEFDIWTLEENGWKRR